LTESERSERNSSRGVFGDWDRHRFSGGLSSTLSTTKYYLSFFILRVSGLSYYYQPKQIATWFLTLLMVFNCGYALIGVNGMHIANGGVEVPKFQSLTKVAVLASVVKCAAGASMFQNAFFFASMPCGVVGDGYFCALGYMGGILSGTHGWLKRDTDADSKDDDKLVQKSRACVVVVALVAIILCFLCYASGAPLNGVIGFHSLSYFIASVILCIPSGLYAPCSWICVMDLFRRISLSSTRQNETGTE